MRIDEFDKSITEEPAVDTATTTSDIPELSGGQLAALRKLMGDDAQKTMYAKRGIEHALAGKAIPSNLSGALREPLSLLLRYVEGGMGDVTRLQRQDQQMHKDQMMNSAENDEAPIEEKETKHTSASLNLAINDALRTADARGITPEIRNSFQGKAKVMWNTAKDTGQSPAETVNQAISAARAEAEAKKDAKKDKEKEAERRDSEKQLKIKAKQDSDDKQVSSPTTVKAESIEDFNLILQKLSGIK